MKIKNLNDAKILEKQIALLKKIGCDVRVVRGSQGCSLKELAVLVGVDASFISNIENGKLNVTVLTLIRICHALDIDLMIEIKAKKAQAS